MFAWDYCLAWILISTFAATYKIAELNMPTSCVAYGCTNKAKAGSGISFHRFPFSDPVQLEKWTKALCRKNWVPKSGSFLCGKHFEPSCFVVHPGK